MPAYIRYTPISNKLPYSTIHLERSEGTSLLCKDLLQMLEMYVFPSATVMVLSTLITSAISSAIPPYLANSSVTSAPSTVSLQRPNSRHHSLSRAPSLLHRSSLHPASCRAPQVHFAHEYDRNNRARTWHILCFGKN